MTKSSRFLEINLDEPWKNEKERIKYYSKKFKKTGIVSAFNEIYGLRLQSNAVADLVPGEVRVGDIIQLSVQSNTKAGVVFDSGNYKQQFVTRNNLINYDIAGKTISVEVVEIQRDRVYVDYFQAIIRTKVVPMATNPWLQNHTNVDDAVGQFIHVRDLRCVRGGYMGIAEIRINPDNHIDLPAFIPGGHIALNHIQDFKEPEGKTVLAHIQSYSIHQGKVSLVCSVKSFYKNIGHTIMHDLYKAWCDEGEKWQEFAEQTYPGAVTGVINSSKKCGVFVEIPELFTTVLIPVPQEELTKYKRGGVYDIQITGFNLEKFYDDAVGQYKTILPFVITESGNKTYFQEVNCKYSAKFI